MASKKKKRPTPPPPPVRTAPPRAKPAAGPSRRQAEREAATQAARRDARRRKLIVAGLVTAAVAAVVGYVVADRRGDAELEQTLTSGSCEVDERTDPTAAAPGNHVPSPTYAVDPPAGGNHLGSGVTSSGVYEGARVPEDGLLVHSLEHGYVVVWHQPDLPADQRAELVRLQEDSGTDVIVVERDSMDVPVAATAWGKRLLCGQTEPEALRSFVDAYVGKGPENVRRT